MKKFLLSSMTVLAGIAASHAATPVTNSGLTFNPATITLSTSDTASFTLASIHNAVEVSKATYDASGTTALSGGFSTPFGASAYKVSGLAAGTHYYVCANHASSGMKGQVIVQGGTSVNPALKNTNAFTFEIAGSTPIAFRMSGETARISVVDIMGRTVWSTTLSKNGAPNLFWDRKLADGQNIAAGTYFVQSTAFDAAQNPVGKLSRTVIQIH